jgi:hypothetical protein
MKAEGAGMSDGSAATLGRLVEVDGYPFLYSPEYGLRVETLHFGYRVSAQPDGDESDTQEPGLNDFVGGRTEVVIAIGLSDEELDKLFALLDADLEHAKKWMLADAQEGHLGAVDELTGWEAVRENVPVDYMLYLSGAGEEARYHTHAGGQLSNIAAAKTRHHERDIEMEGILGKGLPHDARGHVQGDLMFGYNGALEHALDRWIFEGNLLAPAPGGKA